MIETRSLAFGYPSGPQISFPDVSIPQGETLVLRGRSGAGKSTWLALAAGLLSATQGQITVAGQPLQALAPAARDAWRARTLGFLPQKLYLSESLSVAQNLALVHFAAGLRAEPGAIAASLAALDVGDLASRRPSQLSGGQAQRVALARAVLLDPRVLLADEPTASLDDDAATAALELLRATAQRCGATLVVATHDARVERAFPHAFTSQIGIQPPPVLDSPL